MLLWKHNPKVLSAKAKTGDGTTMNIEYWCPRGRTPVRHPVASDKSFYVAKFLLVIPFLVVLLGVLNPIHRA